MKNRKFLPLILLAGLASSTVAMAGTPGITGVFSGNYQLTMRSFVPFNMVQGQSGSHPWIFGFYNGGGVAYIADSSVTSTAAPYPVFNYETYRISQPFNKFLPIADNNDGTYTMNYHFGVDYPGEETPQANTTATFDITLEADGSITIITLDADSDGVVGVGLPSPPFPVVAEPDWHGTASPPM